MRRPLYVFSTVVCTVLLTTDVALARPTPRIQALAETPTYVDIVGDVDGTHPLPQKAFEDTIWIADWNFDAGGSCTDAGWERMDNRIRYDGLNHWAVTGGGIGGDGNQGELDFDGVGNIVGKAAVLGEHDLCWDGDGYDNFWYTGIKFEYEGGSDTYLSFDYLVDSEDGFDFLRVETDSVCSSFSRVDYSVDPLSNAAMFRTVEFAVSGFDTAAATTSVDSLPLTNYGAGIHCVFISFIADGGWSPADGINPSSLAIAAAVDNIVLEGRTTGSEDFEDGVLNGLPAADFTNMQEREPFGQWARVYKDVTDNDPCSENNTCSWLWTDYTTPTIANDPSMTFGPDAYVVRNWLDDIVISPWVSLQSTPDAAGTVLSFRRFPGNLFSWSRIVQQWSVRSKLRIENTDSSTPGDSIDCVSAWGHRSWNSLNPFRWVTSIFDMESFFDLRSTEIQVRFRVSDWQYVSTAEPPSPFIPGPGPYMDRVRIGRRVLTGPKFYEGLDHRFQAQDCFPTEIDPFIPPGTGEHHRPLTGDGARFGTAAFSMGWDIVWGTGPNLVTGDSITVEVSDQRRAGGISSVEWYGSIVAGPHAGKAPPPFTVGTSGFFAVQPDSSRTRDGAAVSGRWFVDLDDDYFRGGDVLHYFWLAEDVLGGVSSDPAGLSGMPTSIEEAEALTGGLLEVSFLPKINWDPGFLSRIAADPNGKLEPTQEELGSSVQSNCILYYQDLNIRRLSSDLYRTSFMYTLDQLGYRGHYDVYDRNGRGNSNDNLGGRVTVAQAQGYALIIQDTGRLIDWTLPDGTDLDGSKIDQAGWYRDWLETASASEAGSATLWLMGSRIVEARPDNPLLTNTMGVVLIADQQDKGDNPDVVGVASFTFENGSTADFRDDLFSVDGGCPGLEPFNALDASGTAVVTHRWKSGNELGDGAIVMNSNVPQSWNTIMMAVPWFDIHDPGGRDNTPPSTPSPRRQLLSEMLSAVLSQGCQSDDPPSDVGEPHDELSNLPKRTALYQNVPNPFNPTTTIRFDLSREGHVSLRIYDVAGRLVRTVVDQQLKPGRYPMTWNGLNEAGRRVPSGVYLYQLVTDEFEATRKLVVMK